MARDPQQTKPAAWQPYDALFYSAFALDPYDLPTDTVRLFRYRIGQQVPGVPQAMIARDFHTNVSPNGGLVCAHHEVDLVQAHVVYSAQAMSEEAYRWIERATVHLRVGPDCFDLGPLHVMALAPKMFDHSIDGITERDEVWVEVKSAPPFKSAQHPVAAAREFGRRLCDVEAQHNAMQRMLRSSKVGRVARGVSRMAGFDPCQMARAMSDLRGGLDDLNDALPRRAHYVWVVLYGAGRRCLGA